MRKTIVYLFKYSRKPKGYLTLGRSEYEESNLANAQALEYRGLLVLGSLFLGLLFILPRVAYAETVKTKSTATGDEVVIEKDDVIDRDFFVSGSTVKVYGTINGDLYAVGGQIIIDGEVNGDILAAGGQISVAGKVSQDIRVVGGQVTINAKVGRNVTAAGGNIDVSESAVIAGSLVGAAGNFNVSGPVGNNATLGVGNLTISNSVGGDVMAGVGTLTLTPKANVAGNVEYWSEEEASVAEGASVSGILSRKDPKKEFGVGSQDLKKAREQARNTLTNTGRVYGVVTFLLFGFLFIKLFPNYLEKSSETLKKKPWRALGYGFLAVFGFPIVFILLLVTIVGVPIAFILLAFYLIYLYSAKLAVMIWAGKFLSVKLNRTLNLNWVFILGLVVYSVLSWIPTVGGAIRLFSLLLGFGTMLITCKALYKEGLAKKIY